MGLSSGDQRLFSLASGLRKKSSVKGAKSIKELIEPSVYDDLFVVSNDANLFSAEEEMSTRYLLDVV